MVDVHRSGFLKISAGDSVSWLYHSLILKLLGTPSCHCYVCLFCFFNFVFVPIQTMLQKNLLHSLLCNAPHLQRTVSQKWDSSSESLHVFLSFVSTVLDGVVV